MHPVVRLARYAIPHRWRFGGAVAAMGIYAAASVALVALIDPIFNDVLRPEDAQRGQSQFWVIAASVVGTPSWRICGPCSGRISGSSQA